MKNLCLFQLTSKVGFTVSKTTEDTIIMQKETKSGNDSEPEIIFKESTDLGHKASISPVTMRKVLEQGYSFNAVNYVDSVKRFEGFIYMSTSD